MDPNELFIQECESRIDSYVPSALSEAGKRFMVESTMPKYCYNFTWMSRPIIQYPQDIVAVQELIWMINPNFIIETGIAHGGSLILSASILAMLDYCDALENDAVLDPKAPRRRVLGIDIDIRGHNKTAIEAHPMANRIDMIQGSSIAPEVVDQVYEMAEDYERILVLLDSNHTHEHVLAELDAYAPLVSAGSYCVVFDTIIDELPDHMYPDRPWNKRDNPKTAVSEFLRRLEVDDVVASDGGPLRFEIDKAIEHKLLITVAPGGYLKRVAG